VKDGAIHAVVGGLHCQILRGDASERLASGLVAIESLIRRAHADLSHTYVPWTVGSRSAQLVACEKGWGRGIRQFDGV
jgi:hypothetical protein